MNWLDILIIIPLCWGIYRGFSNGFVQQVIALVAIIGGVWLSSHYGERFGLSIGISEQWASPCGFVVLLCAVIIIMAVVGRLSRGLFKIAGLGAFDTVLGVVFSVAKTWVIVAVSLFWLNTLPVAQSIISPKAATDSKLLKPMLDSAAILFPYINSATDKLKGGCSPDNSDK